MLANPAPHIVHVTECLASGTMNFLMQATHELAAAGASQVLLYSRRPDTPADVRSLFDQRVQMIELPPLGRDYVRYARALRRKMLAELDEARDVTIHLHSSKAGFLGRLALMGLRRPPKVYYSPHGLSFLNRRYLAPSLVFRVLEWLGARAVVSTAVGCSHGEAALLNRISPTRARVLENAVDDSFFDIEPAPSTPPVVVTMGRVCYQKAPERFAEIAARFLIADVPARFVWIGSGDAAAEARLRAAGVHVTGWVDQAQVQGLLGEASIYVQTSRWEGMPLSVLQALAAGLPCVVTNVVGNRDAVRQGITGFVSDDADSLLISARRLLQDENLRQRMAQAARQDAQERFAGSSFRARLCRLYGLADSSARVTGSADHRLRLALPNSLLAKADAAANERQRAAG